MVMMIVMKYIDLRFMKSVIVVVLMCVAMLASAQKKYDDIYNELSNLSLDQAYSEFLAFQKQNPYFANTYIQLGIICEHKMTHTDPLRDIESAQFWSDNAHLFFGNFKVFYHDGEERSNEEYYENLNIPQSGERLKKEELMAFVDAHEKKCRDFRDSTLMIYTALDKSKSAYNKCINIFFELSKKYANYNELLLCYDPYIRQCLDSMSVNYAICESEFKKYKQLTKAFPVLNYMQFYDKKDIETFRLDGLTNSDFLNNRFTVWDFQKWIADYRKTVDEAIIPLRSEVEKINKMFADGLDEYKSGTLNVALQQPFDDLFFFRLCKYDNGSLVRDLFKYLAKRRELITLGKDELVLDSDSSLAIVNRMMRHALRVSVAEDEALASLDMFDAAVSPARVSRFADFFKANYGGIDGLKKMKSVEISFNHGVLSDVLSAVSDYRKAVNAKLAQPSYSSKSARFPALPLWAVDDYEIGNMNGAYVTKFVAYDSYSRPAYVTGVKKSDLKTVFVAGLDAAGSTSWIIEARKLNDIQSIVAVDGGCMVSAYVGDQPVAVCYSDKGRELLRYNLASGSLSVFQRNAVTKLTKYAYSDDRSASMVVVDSLGSKVLSCRLESVKNISSVQDVDEGSLVIGSGEGRLEFDVVNNDGVIVNHTSFDHDGLKIDAVFRASAQEICIFVSDKKHRNYIVIIDEKGNVIKSTV